MIKGVNKNVVVIKNLKNDIFEEAIFILKPERKKPRKSVIMREVRKIIENETDIAVLEDRIKKLRKWKLSFCTKEKMSNITKCDIDWFWKMNKVFNIFCWKPCWKGAKVFNSKVFFVQGEYLTKFIFKFSYVF